MKTPALTTFALALLVIGGLPADSAKAQNAILAETYGQGVHAYNCGNLLEARRYFTMAIDNGIQDPRAYYYLGIVAAASGDQVEAEADWLAGAQLEAKGRANPSIGRSLARFQGLGRLKLEEIRQKARLTALAVANARSKQRYGELGATPENAAVTPQPPSAVPSAPPAVAPTPVAPPAIPPATDNPFADDMASGEAKVTSDDALEGAMTDPFADDAAPAGGAAPAAGNDPFGGGNDAGGAADPFGGGNDAGGGGADPFGGGMDAAGGADPFGGSDAGAGSDPFGN